MLKLAAAVLLASAVVSPVMAETPAQASKPAPAARESTSAIFGRAAVEKNTVAENRKLAGRGYWSDYFGWYGTQYAQYAVIAGSNGDWWSGRYWSQAAADTFDSAIAHYYMGY